MAFGSIFRRERNLASRRQEGDDWVNFDKLAPCGRGALWSRGGSDRASLVPKKILLVCLIHIAYNPSQKMNAKPSGMLFLGVLNDLKCLI